MSNMAYCRFENTLRDLRDCYHNGMDDILMPGESEYEYRKKLIALCRKIADEYGDQP